MPTAESFALAVSKVGAAKLVLADAKGTDFHEAISKTQAAALAETIDKASLSPEDAATMSVAVAKMDWFDKGDCGMVLSSMQPKGGQPVAKRRAQQDFKSILDYGTDQLWERLTDQSINKPAKLQLILQWATNLGLRLPSEPTLKLLNSVWIVLTHTADEVSSMDSVAN